MFKHMATKTLTITEESYNLLDSRKKERESFSEVKSRILKKNRLANFKGEVSLETANKVLKTRNALNKSFEERLDRLK